MLISCQETAINLVKHLLSHPVHQQQT